jgi:hypothetical protein
MTADTRDEVVPFAAADGRTGNLLHVVRTGAESVHGPALAGKFEALDCFGQLFLSELWQVFGPVRRLAGRAIGSGAVGSGAAA